MVEVTQQTQQKARSEAPPSRFRWTRERYERLVEAGVLTPEDRVELIDGEIVELSQQRSLHATAVTKILLQMLEVFKEGFVVRPQLPLALDPDSEPEPDVVIVTGTVDDFRNAHPSSALLVIEVADTTLATDRARKARLYVRHDIPEYWILNVSDESLEVYREPDPAGETYQTKMTLRAGGTVTPPEASAAVQVDDLLP